MRFPSASCSVARRTLTGTIARRPASGGGSSRASSRARSPPVAAASATSLTVPPSARLMALRSSSGASATAKRRCLPIGPLSDVCGAARTSLRSRSSASARPRRGNSASSVGCRTASTPARRPCSSAAGRCVSPAPSSPAGGASGAGGPRGRVGGRVEQEVRHVDRADAVDHAVMGLARQRPAAVLEPLEQHHLPERLAALEPVRPELRRPFGQLRLAAGRRQRRPPHVARRCRRPGRAPSSAT